MSQSFTIRLPNDVALWIESASKEKGINKSKFVIQQLQDKMQDESKTDVLHLLDTAPSKAEAEKPPLSLMQDKCLTTVLQLQDSLITLTAAVEAATKQQKELTLQLSSGPVFPVSSEETKSEKKTQNKPTKAKREEPKAKKKVRKSKTTKKGGAPAPTYFYEGREATLREHLTKALPQLTSTQIGQARNNINRRLKGRKGRRSGKQWTPEEAIKREIELWEEKLG